MDEQHWQWPSAELTGEGAGLDDPCQGVVRRYRDAGEPELDAIYVDRDYRSQSGVLRSICAVMFLMNLPCLTNCFSSILTIGNGLTGNDKNYMY